MKQSGILLVTSHW